MKLRPVFLGLIAGLVGVVLLVLYMRRFEQEATGGKKIELLVTVARIERGKVITEDMLGVREVPQAYVDDRAIRASDREKVVNLKATSTIPVAQTLAWTDIIAAADEQRDLSSLVQPGNRAMPVRIDQTDILSLIRPGDFVDIIGILGQGEVKDATVLLQRVLVLAAGLDTEVSQDTAKRYERYAAILTVSVSLQEAQILTLAEAKGTLQVVVRNPDDQRITDTVPDLPQSSLLDGTKRQQLQARSRRVPGGGGPTRIEAENKDNE